MLLQIQKYYIMYMVSYFGRYKIMSQKGIWKISVFLIFPLSSEIMRKYSAEFILVFLDRLLIYTENGTQQNNLL